MQRHPYDRGARMGRMNVEGDAVMADAKALAGLRGASVTDAARQAVDARLAGEASRRKDGNRRKVAALMAMSERDPKLVPAGVMSDHGAPL